MTEEFGLSVGKALYGLSDSEFTKIATFVDTLHADKMGHFHKQAAGLAASLYSSLDRKDLVGYHIYTKMASHIGPWPSSFTDLILPVYDVLNRHNLVDEQAFEKQANALDSVAKALGGAVSNYPKLLGISALLGAGTGALGWQLGQDDLDDDEDAVRMRAQMRYLNSITDEIDGELRRRARLG